MKEYKMKKIYKLNCTRVRIYESNDPGSFKETIKDIRILFQTNHSKNAYVVETVKGKKKSGTLYFNENGEPFLLYLGSAKYEVCEIN